jgi:sugar lactone lactonase YvrE
VSSENSASVLTELVTDLVFPEGPRWHDGQLWFADMHDGAIHRVGLDGILTTVLRIPGREPSGLGFMPNGDLLFVDMQARHLVRFDGERETLHADLSGLTPDKLNDMVVDRDGRAYVGSFPLERDAGVLIEVDADRSARVVATELDFPNGTVLSEDGRTLVVTESRARRHSAFDVATDGSLSNRRVFAEVPEAAGDGLALDAEGALWSALPLGNQVVRVLEGGEITHRIALGEAVPLAVMLGGPERRTLFILSSCTAYASQIEGRRLGRIDYVEVSVPGAGLP